MRAFGPRFKHGLATAATLAILTAAAAQARAEAIPPRLGAGYSHSWARKADGTLWCWGANDSGQLGNDSTQSSNVPLQVTALGNQVAQVSLGDLFTCAIKLDHTLWCWGNNVAGQLGDGLTDDSLVPVPITAVGNDVAEVSAGDLFTCARKGDGTLWCWGSGFLGDGTNGQRSTPGQVTLLGSNVAQVSTGGAAACARKTDGTLWCWGDHEFGIVGDGTTVDRLTPVQVTGLGTAVAEVSVGDVFACARTTDGNVWCWGTNDHAQLGDGSTADHFIPAVIVGLGKPAIQISANGRHACAVRSDNALGCWGSSFNGEVGDGTVIDRPNPVKVSVLPSAVAEVSAGVNHTTCARMSDGRVACWGYNGTGALGDGTTLDRRVPVQALPPTSPGAPIPAGGGWTSAALALLLTGVAIGRLRRARA
jgi:alpha-tubulin suppressor-like RCC1 family protein